MSAFYLVPGAKKVLRLLLLCQVPINNTAVPTVVYSYIPVCGIVKVYARQQQSTYPREKEVAARGTKADEPLVGVCTHLAVYQNAKQL